jgi:hypothetical protein
MGRSSFRGAALGAAAILAAVLCGMARAQETAPVQAEAFERALREERTRHAEAVRRLAEEEDRLRSALDAATARLAESDGRRAALARLVAEAEAALAPVEARLAGIRAVLESVHRAVADAARRLAARAVVPPELLAGGDAARRVRLLFQVFDRELAAARAVAVTPRERAGVLGHEVRLGAIATFFVPASGGPALLEPSGRALPGAVGEALRDVVRQVSRRGRASLVRLPWWGGT